MEHEILEATIIGNVQFLKGVLNKDGMILKKFVAGIFNWSPLHVAISLGHTDLVKELLSLNSDLAEVVDSRYQSGLHLASAQGHTQIVETLIEARPEMCLARDRDGRNPLHVAAVKGKVEVLRELVHANRPAARARVEQDKTILHLCVEYNQLKALQLLLDMIRDEEFVNAKDHSNNTVLHLAVREKQTQTVKHILNYSQIEVNAKNANGHTAMDLLCMLDSAAREGEISLIKKSLLEANGKRAEHVMKFDWVERKDILMVVASVIAASMFQAAVNPPGGVWQDTTDTHKVGEAVMAYTYPRLYSTLITTNSVGFLISIMSMFYLTSPFHVGPKIFGMVLMCLNYLLISSLASSYIATIHAVTPEKRRNLDFLFVGFIKKLSLPSSSSGVIVVNILLYSVVMLILLSGFMGIWIIYDRNERVQKHKVLKMISRESTAFNSGRGSQEDV